MKGQLACMSFKFSFTAHLCLLAAFLSAHLGETTRPGSQRVRRDHFGARGRERDVDGGHRMRKGEENHLLLH